MGHKVHPKGMRIGKIYTWSSKWFSDGKKYSKLIRQDILLKEFLQKELRDAMVENIEIERSPTVLTITIYSAKPGMVIGRGGAGIEELKNKINNKIIKKRSIADIGKVTLNINIKEVSAPHLSAPVIGQMIIADLEKRIPYRRALKQALGKIERAGAGGGKVMVSGRLNGAEIARSEFLSFGKIPLHTLRADIDYFYGIARTIYGALGVKVWIYKGEIFDTKENKDKNTNQENKK